ncbi:dockerin domain-containing protein [Desulfonema magnum]|uniref:Dockerin domain-containing protein n=1 Tax=Desulfonema magnum TaxID=45655 RepID=A0A975BHY7_9BACT|nr:dockerin domain-containing protein [Desulfonema magnum]
MTTFKFIIIILTAPLVFIFSAAFSCAEGLTHFTDFKRIPSGVCTYAGEVTINGTNAADGEDEVGVFVGDGNGGELLAGAAVIGEAFPGYYFVHIYPDDVTTSEKDGAESQEVLIFRVWDKSEDKEYSVPPSAPYMTYKADEFLVRPSFPPLWTTGTVLGFGLLNLAPPVIRADTDGSGNIDLKDAILVLQIITQIDSDSDVYADAHVSGDGKIGVEAAIYVLRVVADELQPVE